MRCFGCCLLGTLFLLGPTLAPPPEAGPDQTLPEARRVVVRGQKHLDAALAAAFGGGPQTAQGTAAVIVDVTPHTRAAGPALQAAFRALAKRKDLPTRWRIARLGQAFKPALKGADRLAHLLPTLLKDDTQAPNTTAALLRSLKSLKEQGGTLIYLADWHFEDEHDLKGLIHALAAKKMRFGVVGSEAAFGRGWNDGVLDLRDRLKNGALTRSSGPEPKLYDEAIGRRPFGPFDRKSPWFGGDTAYPHLPYRFAEKLWVTEFSPSDLSFGEKPLLNLARGKNPEDMEDLLQRLGRKREVFSSSSFRRFPLPSAFGPQGLMRAVALAGGRYVLWSWNPEHRVTIRYDHARCDLFGPDLRSRSEIRRNVAHRPAGIALLRAWDQIGSKFNALAAHTAPLDRGGRTPRSIDLLEREARSLPRVWPKQAMHRYFLKKAGHWRDAARGAIKTLNRGLEKAGEPKDATDRRYRADAHLFRHILKTLHFELSEAYSAASKVSDDSWDDEQSYPGLMPVTWIERGDDPEAIHTTGATLFDAALGKEFKAARAELLRRYRGTPFGLQVAANTVDTWKLRRFPKLESHPTPLRPPGRTPSDSGDTPKPTPRTPGGGSGSGGPSTGR